ncbi:hypothetical protein A6R68_20948 [Neotoma lepida]|uniref:Uncharacterized protein n=1 Tax=Neotoma lepida TaxID=56216 RepID=A0A1A6HRJ9_NEOLE|nr:hypothetical protein A6R68_20948 [Neotoma lepida]
MRAPRVPPPSPRKAHSAVRHPPGVLMKTGSRLLRKTCTLRRRSFARSPNKAGNEHGITTESHINSGRVQYATVGSITITEDPSSCGLEAGKKVMRMNWRETRLMKVSLVMSLKPAFEPRMGNKQLLQPEQEEVEWKLAQVSTLECRKCLCIIRLIHHLQAGQQRGGALILDTFLKGKMVTKQAMAQARIRRERKWKGLGRNRPKHKTADSFPSAKDGIGGRQKSLSDYATSWNVPERLASEDCFQSSSCREALPPPTFLWLLPGPNRKFPLNSNRKEKKLQAPATRSSHTWTPASPILTRIPDRADVQVTTGDLGVGIPD